MHRTEGVNNAANLFENGPPGTVVEEDWLNAVQEEICNVIEGSGLILKTAATETRDQLWAAIQSLAFPVDTKMVFVNTLPPTGWTRDAALQDGSQLVYSQAGAIAAGGAVDAKAAHTHTAANESLHTHTGGGHVLTKAELPKHTHEVYYSNVSRPSYDAAVKNIAAAGSSYTSEDGTTDGLSDDSHSHGATSGGSAHTHTINDNTAPYYIEIIIATKT